MPGLGLAAGGLRSRPRLPFAPAAGCGASLRAQVQARHEVLALQDKQLKVVEVQFNAGVVARSAVLTQNILMTTAAMAFGVVPLVIASGAGAAGRHAMGLVIFTGMSIAPCSHCLWCPPCPCCWPASTTPKPPRRWHRRRPYPATRSQRVRSSLDK